jgi:predicted house-cleaning noncanonical NTP pyrophosphatase (MazG superfamily)
MSDKIELNKLVRDKVPELLEAKQVKATFHEASPEEFETELLEKLREEVLEFKNANSIEQLADLLQVVDEVISEKGWDKFMVDQVKAQRLNEKGGFSKRLILESTE